MNKQAGFGRPCLPRRSLVFVAAGLQIRAVIDAAKGAGVMRVGVITKGMRRAAAGGA